ncbi:MAG TPA: flagellar basal body P-ring formation chaperone FlgA [Candidatus Helicobacter avicola]|nr:flagellar basal body P-ring formation chaperone FlgA [Candidatus Helicobacter avicola]
MCFRILLVVMLLWGMLGSEEITQHTIAPKEYTLASSYTLSHTQILSTSLFPQIPKSFIIATFPQQSFSFKMRSYEVAAIFERHGFVLHTPHSDVEFVYRSSMELEKPKTIIKRLYTEYFESVCPGGFVIDWVSVRLQDERQARNLNEFLSHADFELFGKQAALKKSSGVLVARTKDSKVLFVYEIGAHFKALYTTKTLNAGEGIEGYTESRHIVFQKLGALPVCESEVAFGSARSYLPKDTFLTKDKLRPLVLVRKGEPVLVQSVGGGFALQTRLEALQNGSFGEVIEARANESKKILKVKIVGKNQGVVL